MKFTVYSDLSAAPVKKLVARLADDADVQSPRSVGRTIAAAAEEGFPYLDASGADERAFRKKVAELADKGIAFGVLDPLGAIADPASLMFAGAKDYVGPALFKAGVDAARLEDAAVRSGAREGEGQATAFPGWRKLVEGREYRFLFCYSAICDQAGLRGKIGETRLAALRDSYAAHMASVFMETNGLLWMKDQNGILLVFPEDPAGESPVKIAYELLVNRALIGYESFRLEVPIGFKFVFHAGATVWRRPGSTGSVVSEDVNFIHHLALRHAEDDRITVSGTCLKAIPPQIEDLFSAGAKFEGHKSYASIAFK